MNNIIFKNKDGNVEGTVVDAYLNNSLVGTIFYFEDTGNTSFSSTSICNFLSLECMSSIVTKMHKIKSEMESRDISLFDINRHFYNLLSDISSKKGSVVASEVEMDLLDKFDQDFSLYSLPINRYKEVMDEIDLLYTKYGLIRISK